MFWELLAPLWDIRVAVLACGGHDFDNVLSMRLPWSWPDVAWIWAWVRPFGFAGVEETEKTQGPNATPEPSNQTKFTFSAATFALPGIGYVASIDIGATTAARHVQKLRAARALLNLKINENQLVKTCDQDDQ